MTKQGKDYSSIWSNYINGNLKDFSIDVKKLTKIQIVDMIYLICDRYQNIKYTVQEILNIFNKALTKKN